MYISIEMPPQEAQQILRHLTEQHGFREIDWCELQRPDFARVTYAPSPKRTGSGFTIAPFDA